MYIYILYFEKNSNHLVIVISTIVFNNSPPLIQMCFYAPP